MYIILMIWGICGLFVLGLVLDNTFEHNLKEFDSFIGVLFFCILVFFMFPLFLGFYINGLINRSK